MMAATEGTEALGLAAALLAAGGPRPADQVRAVAAAVLRQFGYTPPITAWTTWGVAVRGMRARGMLVDNAGADTWAPGATLATILAPSESWLSAARAAWTAGVQPSADLSQVLPLPPQPETVLTTSHSAQPGHYVALDVQATRPPELAMLSYELDGVLADVEHGQGGNLDPVCIRTLQRVSARLHQLAHGVKGPEHG